MRIYICSPYRAKGSRSRLDNIRRAERYAEAVRLLGHTPIYTHGRFDKMLDDEVEAHREAAMCICIKLLTTCDAMWVCGDYISEGMRAEEKAAKSLGVPVFYLQRDGVAMYLKEEEEETKNV